MQGFGHGSPAGTTCNAECWYLDRSSVSRIWVARNKSSSGFEFNAEQLLLAAWPNQLEWIRQSKVTDFELVIVFQNYQTDAQMNDTTAPLTESRFLIQKTSSLILVH